VTAPTLERHAIRVLPAREAEKIAAGEVIERPASVVKELVENALDAGARQIRVEVRGGGLRLVRVVDDGCGIPADEIALAFERHATSKIRRVADLERVTTLGFRGEALPSIAAVAEVAVHTAVADEVGHEALVRGGRVVALAPRPRARGTTVEVRHLFQTVPARLKFVADARREVAAISALVRRYALARPGVCFQLLVEGRLALRTTGGGPAAVLAELYGTAVAEALRPLPPLALGEARLQGYLSERHVTRPHRGDLTLVVNGRWVEARELLTALEAAYRPLLPRGRHPIAVLYCDLPPAAVDVNVHPAKTEVRFLHGRELAEGLAAWVREALSRSPLQLPPDIDLGLLLPSAPDGEPQAAAATSEAAPASLHYPLNGARPSWYRIAEGWPRHDEPAAGDQAPAAPSSERGAGSLPPLRLIGQVQEALLLCEGPGGLYLVDQHRAHERVLYERLRARHGPAAETPIEPLVLELRPAQAARLAARLPALAALGFTCEWFGGRSFLVRAAPALPATSDLPAAAVLGSALEEVLTEAATEEDNWQDRLLVAVACRAALRRGQRLPPDVQAALLAALARTAAPAACPHGSPLILQLSRPFLARQFRWQ